MQKTDCLDWYATCQLMTTSDLGRWPHSHLHASFASRPPHSPIFDAAGCFHQSLPTPSTSYVEQLGREWFASYASYRRLKQLECWSELDKTTSGQNAVDVDTVPRHRCWSGDRDDRQSLCRDLKDQLSSGSYINGVS